MKTMKFKRVMLLATLLVMTLSAVTGGTIAWFTDSAASANNVITSGNLDINVQYTLDGENWADLDGASDLFQKSLWEPGHTEVVVLKIENVGSLAAKYAANMNIVNETIGKTKDGKDIKLSDILTVDTCTQQYTDSNGNIASGADIFPAMAFNSEGGVDGWIGYQTTAKFKDANVLKTDKQLQPKEADYLAIKVDMAETVGNEANHNGTDIPSIEFGINVEATQWPSETDSFGSDYDKDALYPGEFVVSNTEELVAAFAEGGSITLADDIVLDERLNLAEDKEVYLDLNGKTITAEGTTVDPVFYTYQDYVSGFYPYNHR